MNITFLGATQTVTGSCFLIQVGKKKILVECGLYQGDTNTEQLNKETFGFNPKEIDAVILTHAHLDHSGRLPLLIKNGFQGKIYTQHATKDLSEILLSDAGYLNEKDVEIDNRKRARRHLPKLTPLYTYKDAQATIKYITGCDYDKKIKITDGVEVTFRDAGHILGSAIVELFLSENGETRKLVFSGDLGHKNIPILRDPSYIKSADLVIMESTYGNRNHRRWEETIEELGNIFREAKNKKGNILIPAFTIGRTQELLYLMHEYFDEWELGGWQVFLDSPMAIEATKVYAKHWKLYDKAAKKIIREEGSPYRLPNLKLSQTTQESMGINQFVSGAIIIAGSGMCAGGRIRHHLKHNIWRHNCHVVIVGFQAQNTLGRQLVDGVDEIKLWGEPIKVAAKIHTVGGLSAHGDQQQLLDWYGHFVHAPQCVLVHGEKLALETLQQKLQNTHSCQPWIATHGMGVDLVGMTKKNS